MSMFSWTARTEASVVRVTRRLASRGSLKTSALDPSWFCTSEKVSSRVMSCPIRTYLEPEDNPDFGTWQCPTTIKLDYIEGARICLAFFLPSFTTPPEPTPPALRLPLIISTSRLVRYALSMNAMVLVCCETDSVWCLNIIEETATS